MTITQEDLRKEFTDFRGHPPLATDTRYLLFLLRQEVLSVRKFEIPVNFQYPLSGCLFPQLQITKHLGSRQNTTAFIIFKVNKFVKRLGDNCLVASEYPYSNGYRSDIAIVKDDEVVLSVELGSTQWGKIKECLLDINSLQEFWHFPDLDYYFIWRRGRNYKHLRDIEKRWEDMLQQLEQERRKEIIKKSLWYLD